MKNAGILRILGVAISLSAGLLLAGCKSAPDLSQTDALNMVQAKYDQAPAAGATIVVNNQGMLDGITAKYWTRTTIYPNRVWADFTLTPDGEKVIKLQDGGKVIKWRPQTGTDQSYSVTVETVAANHLKAHDLQNLQDEAGGAKGADFTESVDLTGVPDALQAIAHNQGNQLSTKRHAEFAYADGVWKLQSVE